MQNTQRREERTAATRMLEFYDRACLRYAACVEELQAAADSASFAKQLAAAAAARENCAAARARAAAYLRNNRAGRCCIYR